MKKKWQLRTLMLFIMLLVGLGMFLTREPAQVKAASKRTYYYGGGLRKKEYTGWKDAAVKKVYIKGNKLYVKGSLLKFNKEDDYDNAIYLKQKLRKFKITNKTKYYSRGGTGPDEYYSKSVFKYRMKHYFTNSGLGFTIKVKNGKVIWVEICS